MSNPIRMLDGSRQPTDRRVAEFIGKQNTRRWAEISEFIEANYPGIFSIEWLFGGKKHGWSLRFKKSKSFCTFVPERGSFKLLLVFGEQERQRIEQLLPALISHVREDYEKSPTYNDGKWVLVKIDSAKVIADVKQLLRVKRTPRAKKGVAVERSITNRGVVKLTP